jgi:hypothetical protein
MKKRGISAAPAWWIAASRNHHELLETRALEGRVGLDAGKIEPLPPGERPRRELQARHPRQIRRLADLMPVPKGARGDRNDLLVKQALGDRSGPDRIAMVNGAIEGFLVEIERLRAGR